MSRRLHREIQLECSKLASANDSSHHPVMSANGRRILGYVDMERNFSTARYGRSECAARIFLLSDPYKQHLSRAARRGNCKTMRYGRAYGLRSDIP